MQGTIVKVLVEKGQEVRPGDVICILEAMKMENHVPSTRDGEVTDLPIHAGQVVETGAGPRGDRLASDGSPGVATDDPEPGVLHLVGPVDRHEEGGERLGHPSHLEAAAVHPSHAGDAVDQRADARLRVRVVGAQEHVAVDLLLEGLQGLGRDRVEAGDHAGPLPRIAWACSAADPCQGRSTCHGRPPTAVASGLVASRTTAPGATASLIER